MRILVDLHRHRLGRGLGDHAGDVLLHQPHAAARGAGELAGAADGAAAAAPHADHLSDQRRCISTARASAASAIRRCSPSISLIDEHGGRRVRMGNLAFIGSHKINGVSALHTDLMRETVFRDLDIALSRPHRQQDQRHHLPPLADRVPIRGLTADRRPRRSASRRSTTPRRCSELGRHRRRRGAAGAGRRSPGAPTRSRSPR